MPSFFNVNPNYILYTIFCKAIFAFSLVVEAAMKKSKELVYRAVYMDPLTSAVCSMEEIKNMCDELFEINKEFLCDYK